MDGGFAQEAIYEVADAAREWTASRVAALEAASSAVAAAEAEQQVRKRCFLPVCKWKNDHFAKTGWGQT